MKHNVVWQIHLFGPVMLKPNTDETVTDPGLVETPTTGDEPVTSVMNGQGTRCLSNQSYAICV